MCNDFKYSVSLYSQDRIDQTFKNWNTFVYSEKLPNKLVEIWGGYPGRSAEIVLYVTVDGIIHKSCSGTTNQLFNDRIPECTRYGVDTHKGITYEQLQKVFQSLKIPFDNTAIEITVHML